MCFLGFGEEVRDFTGDKDGGYPTNADSLDCVGNSAVGGETLGKVKGDLDNCFNGGPPLQVLMEGGVVADFGVDLVEGNVFQERSVRFAFVICACEFCESGGEKLLFVDHNEVKFVQRRRKVVRREAHSIKEIINRVVVRCEDEQLGAFLVAANLPGHVVGQSRSHLNDSCDVIWRESVAPR